MESFLLDFFNYACLERSLQKADAKAAVCWGLEVVFSRKSLLSPSCCCVA